MRNFTICCHYVNHVDETLLQFFYTESKLPKENPYMERNSIENYSSTFKQLIMCKVFFKVLNRPKQSCCESFLRILRLSMILPKHVYIFR